MSKPSLKQRLEQMTAAYGPVALGTWFAIFFATWFGFWIAVKSGFQPEGAAAGAGTVGAAYLATQLTKPLRVVATLALTPLVARWLGREPAADAPSEAPAVETP